MLKRTARAKNAKPPPCGEGKRWPGGLAWRHELTQILIGQRQVETRVLWTEAARSGFGEGQAGFCKIRSHKLGRKNNNHDIFCKGKRSHERDNRTKQAGSRGDSRNQCAND